MFFFFPVHKNERKPIFKTFNPYTKTLLPSDLGNLSAILISSSAGKVNGKTIIFLRRKKKVQSSWQKYSVLYLSNLYSTMIIKTTYLNFIAIQEGSNYVFLLEVSIQLLYQENFGSHASHMWYIFISTYVPGLGWLTKEECAHWNSYVWGVFLRRPTILYGYISAGFHSLFHISLVLNVIIYKLCKKHAAHLTSSHFFFLD